MLEESSLPYHVQFDLPMDNPEKGLVGGLWEDLTLRQVFWTEVWWGIQNYGMYSRELLCYLEHRYSYAHWEHGISKIQEYFISSNLFILSHLSFCFQWRVTTVLTIGHSLYWGRISSGLWIKVIHTRLSLFYLLSSITLLHVLADGHSSEWMKWVCYFFIHQFSTYCLSESLLFSKICSEVHQ